MWLLALDLTAAPEVGYNLTYVCPEGQVFDHDWFATPFVFMTCQVKDCILAFHISWFKKHLFKDNGEFDEPDWDGYECVFRKLQST